MPIPTRRIAATGLLLPAQASGQTGTPGEGAATPQALPRGSEEAEGAFGIFGMMISGLIILSAIVILFLRFHRRR